MSKAKQLLGYEPSHRFKEGLKEAMDWYVKNLTVDISTSNQHYLENIEHLHSPKAPPKQAPYWQPDATDPLYVILQLQ